MFLMALSRVYFNKTDIMYISMTFEGLDGALYVVLAVAPARRHAGLRSRRRANFRGRFSVKVISV